MALDATVRAAVAAAKTAVADLLVDVDHEAWSSYDGDGKPTYAAAVTYQAFVWTYGGQARRAKVSRIIGAEDVEGPNVLFLQNVTITTKDRLTLPDGSTPPINAVLGVVDPASGQYFTEVRCGRPERGVIS